DHALFACFGEEPETYSLVDLYQDAAWNAVDESEAQLLTYSHARFLEDLLSGITKKGQENHRSHSIRFDVVAVDGGNGVAHPGLNNPGGAESRRDGHGEDDDTAKSCDETRGKILSGFPSD